MKKIDVMITAFRDGFQSVYGARVLTKDFIPALEAASRAGLRHFEVGGGARFQSLYFYCNEDAFEMMDACREAAGPDANLQTLARGINVVGLESQPSDMIKLHAELFKKHGITTIRNFDALNDVENLDYSGRCIEEAGLQHEIAITLMGLPPGLSGAHTAEFYDATLQQILKADIPFHSLVFKDASGTATPKVVYETIKLAKQRLPGNIPTRFHTHDTAGTATLTYKAALEAGVDGIDLSMAPVSGGTAQPDVMVMWHALRGTDFDLDIDIDKVLEAEEVFKDCMKDYFMPPEALAVEPLIPFSPMPGGALTANTQMMRDHNVLDRFPDVIDAMREVVARGGFATSVTPVSQFYFQQAFNNVMFGPWAKIAEGYGHMVLGYYGKTPTEPDPEIVAVAREQLQMEPTTESPRVLNDRDPKKGRAAAEAALKEAGLEMTDENVFIAATCKDRGIAFLKGEGKLQVRKNEAPAAQAAGTSSGGGDGTYTVTLEGERYTVKVQGGTATVNGTSYPFKVEQDSAAGAPAPGGAATPSGEAVAVTAPMPGVVLKALVRAGDSVAAGQPVMLMESMKMEMNVEAEVAGVVGSIEVSDGDHVVADQKLLTITPTAS
ncbi:biotin/lipoyl-containing protein [Alkalispirochaeta alkalica]|uniref:biotin/lipoyl-containing protein n=1 Tax=Alkalispirochaeta alkalica TaxID=46356 RepID=UPI00036DF8FD|nr:biotin/lipoyl-containing protein [Alkalispirochaeta alkalica]